MQMTKMRQYLLLILIVKLIASFVVSQKLDVPKGPWRLVFKAVQGKTSGPYNNFWDLYLSRDTLNSDSVKEKRDFTLTSQPFKSIILEDWALSKTNVQAVRLSFFKNNTEQQYIVFDAVGKTKSNWFSCSDILYSSFSDITTVVINRCTPSESTQRLAIETETVVSAPDCESVAGFIIAVDKNYTGMLCKNVYLPVNSSIQPYFRYSWKGTVGKFATDMEYADSVAIFVQVWDMTMKGVSGVDGTLYSLWLSNDVREDENTAAKTLTKDPSLTYKSGLVNNWSFYNIDMVKYAMFKSGLEKAYVVFNGINTNKTSWFSNDKILFSLYDDIFNTKTECSILGDGIRRWEIHNAQNVGCTDDKSWMEILDDKNGTEVCSWDKDITLSKPYFLYSSNPVAVFCESGGYRNPDFASAEVMGIFVHGGRLVFKVSDGGNVSPASDLYALWTGNFTLNEDDSDAYSFKRGSKTLKSKVLNEWDNYYIRGVKVAFYKDGLEQAYVVFDATAAGKTDWFSKKRVLYSSYSDINNSTFLAFSAEGKVEKSQRLLMAESLSDCESSVGWMVVLDINNIGVCTWERFTNDSRPAFVYLMNSKGRFADGIAADSFAVFLDMENCPGSVLCENNGTCEDLGGNFICHCVNGYYGRTCSNKDGNFSAWSNWTVCPVTCGGGIQTRHRTCDNPAPKGNGVCYGESVENKTCNTEYCPIDGGFSEWTEWSNCTETCGGGIQNRSRKCDNPQPQYGGFDCVGDFNETQSCNVQHCPVNGNWSEWTAWSTCTVTCSGGVETRSRTCDNPSPNYGGANCTGNTSEIQECNTETCPPVNGNWSTWSDWSQCSITCSDEGGNQTRFRTCTNPKPDWGGLNCTEEDTETQQGCNNFSCPINGSWSAWSSWSQCSITCSDGGGNQTRFRNCTNPEPQWGGLNCTGNVIETQQGCNNFTCPGRCINYNPKNPSQCEFDDNGTTDWRRIPSYYIYLLALLTLWCLRTCLQ